MDKYSTYVAVHNIQDLAMEYYCFLSHGGTKRCSLQYYHDFDQCNDASNDTNSLGYVSFHFQLSLTFQMKASVRPQKNNCYPLFCIIMFSFQSVMIQVFSVGMKGFVYTKISYNYAIHYMNCIVNINELIIKVCSPLYVAIIQR